MDNKFGLSKSKYCRGVQCTKILWLEKYKPERAIDKRSQERLRHSLHIEAADGTLPHKEFLAREGTDPRRALAEQLCRDIPVDVCCVAYHKSTEQGIIKRLGDLFPDLHDHLGRIHDNIRDLLEPFQKRYYYCEEMDGSASIKDVLPALYPNDPELDYSSLEQVHKGDEASDIFAHLAEQTPEVIMQTRQNLLKYCGLDTLAMVKLVAKLKEACV